MNALCLFCAGLLLAADQPAPAASPAYDPLAVPSNANREPNGRTVDLTVKDAARNREIPIRVYLPPGDSQTVVLFSHGLGGSREGSTFLGKHWSARGYTAVFVQHPGSDESVWRDQPLAKRMSAMRDAASLKNFMLRAEDIPVVLDQLEKWDQDSQHPLAGKAKTKRVGMSGHSFGGHTTQAVSGQNFGIGGQRLTDKRVKAAIVMSPSAPERGDVATAFGKVSIPWLLMTGTKDTAAIGGQTVESRRKVYPALPPGDKFELVLENAEHSVFTDRALPGDQQQRNPAHHRAILALSTAFWDAYLRDDADAKAWLAGPAARQILAPGDEWSKK
ncbi:MAG: dienelactone hydrolase [Pirellulales bacterium]